MNQTRHQTDLDNRWHDTGYEDLGIGFDPSPESLRRLLDSETSDQHSEATQHWTRKIDAKRFENFVKWFCAVVITAGIIDVILHLMW